MSVLVEHKLIKASDFYFNQSICKKLNTIIQNIQKSKNFNELPNMLFNGYCGSGKYSTILYFILNLFDYEKTDNQITKDNFDIFKTEILNLKIKKQEYSFKQSKYFLIIDDLNSVNDKNVVQQIIKSYILKKTIDDKIKFIIIQNIDKFSYYAQMSLRRSMEIYNQECKFILSSENPENIIEPLKSRCINFRFTNPTNSELNNLLNHLILKHKLKIPTNNQKQIIENSNNNITLFFANLNNCIFGFDYYKNNDIFYQEIYNNLFDNELTNFIIIRNQVIELLKNNEQPLEIVTKITNKINNKYIDDYDVKLKINHVTKKTVKKLKSTSIDLIVLDDFLSEILFILVN